MFKRVLFCLFLCSVFTFAAPKEGSAQCAMCRATVENSLNGDEGRAGAGLNGGILYLLSIPYAIFAVVGYFWYKNSKRRRILGDKVKAAGHSIC